MNKRQEREGTRVQNVHGEWMTAADYNNSRDMFAVFDNGERTHTTWQNFMNGHVRNAFTPSVMGLGYLGKGNYPTIKNGQADKVYALWLNMLTRTYNSKFHKFNPRYEDCEIDPVWLNYSTFYEDVQRMCPHFYDEDVQYELDKDLLHKGNRVYGPNTCCFLPGELNTILLQATSARGEYPVGVTLYTQSSINPYRATISRSGAGKPKLVKGFPTIEEAFVWYCAQKKVYLLERVEYWRKYLTKDAYMALLRWEPCIDD